MRSVVSVALSHAAFAFPLAALLTTTTACASDASSSIRRITATHISLNLPVQRYAALTEIANAAETSPDGKYVGEFCASSDPGFLASKGVVAESDLPGHARPAEASHSGWVATYASGEPILNRD